jgi:membrane protein DedA with SNARE-associated domain
MHLGTFSVFTIIASGIWNSALVLLGAAFGSQYDQVEAYTEWIDRVLYVAIAAVVVTFVVRRIRRVRAERRTGGSDDHDDAAGSPAVGGARGRRRAEPARD